MLKTSRGLNRGLNRSLNRGLNRGLNNEDARLRGRRHRARGYHPTGCRQTERWRPTRTIASAEEGSCLKVPVLVDSESAISGWRAEAGQAWCSRYSLWKWWAIHMRYEIVGVGRNGNLIIA